MMLNLNKPLKIQCMSLLFQDKHFKCEPGIEPWIPSTLACKPLWQPDSSTGTA